MAKETNKTEHVLSLLSGTDAAVEKDEKKETEKKGTGQENDTAVQENPAVNRRGNVHVVLANGGEGDPVAEIVKEKLQEELDNYPLPSEEGSSIDMDIPSEEPAAEAAPGSYEARGKQTSGEAQLSEKEELSQKEEQSPKEQKPEVMDGFVFYNIMESIVQEKAIKYMKQFGNCTCKRCEADTIALALSKLPPKYVVAKADSISPLLNFYEDHYAGQIIVEITKACIVVNKNPRHNR